MPALVTEYVCDQIFSLVPPSDNVTDGCWSTGIKLLTAMAQSQRESSKGYEKQANSTETNGQIKEWGGTGSFKFEFTRFLPTPLNFSLLFLFSFQIALSYLHILYIGIYIYIYIFI